VWAQLAPTDFNEIRCFVWAQRAHTNFNKKWRKIMKFTTRTMMIVTMLALIMQMNCDATENNGSGDSNTDPTSMTDSEIVTADAAATEITFGGTDTEDGITTDITLPTTGENGSTITWSSDNPDVIASDGTVTQPPYGSGDTTVTLTATITSGGETSTVTFVVVVLQTPPTDAQAVPADKAALEITYAPGDSASSVTQNVSLSTAGSYGTNINWDSDTPGTIAIDGTVTRPIAGSGNPAVTLTATISKGLESDTKVFNLTVIEDVPAAPTSVAAVSGTNNTKITISWNASTGATSYNIYWSLTPGVTVDPANLLLAGATSPYVDSGLTTGTDYYYIVTAVGVGGESAASSEAMMYPYLSPLKTYQTTVYATGDDATYQAGRATDFTGPTDAGGAEYITTDNATGLVWKTCSEGLSGADCTTVTATTMTWATATGAGTGCDALNSGSYAGRTNWRLPTPEELESLINYNTSSPAAFATNFPATVANLYWSSSTYVPSTTDAWGVAFTSGNVGYYNKTNSYYVRCVASGS
jgi:hypothetical protein